VNLYVFSKPGTDSIKSKNLQFFRTGLPDLAIRVTVGSGKPARTGLHRGLRLDRDR